jgi:uncharacterized membrane protein
VFYCYRKLVLVICAVMCWPYILKVMLFNVLMIMHEIVYTFVIYRGYKEQITLCTVLYDSSYKFVSILGVPCT